jgi:hypothetical protein
MRMGLYTRSAVNAKLRFSNCSNIAPPKSWEGLVHLTIAELSGQPACAVVDADLPLANASRQGDVSAFEEPVSYGRKLYGISPSIMHNHEDAEQRLCKLHFYGLLELAAPSRQRKVLMLADWDRHQRIIHAIAKGYIQTENTFDQRARIHLE